LIASNVVFGLVHAVTPLYAVLAMVVGVYLSLSVNFGGETNLLIPILIHSLYDFFAFVLLMRNFRSRLIVS
jgi:membrane protease YdiL (CAAX protease family)